MSTIGSDTRIRLNLVATLITVAFTAGVLWFKMDAVQRDIRRSWTIQHQIIWAERLAVRNPGLSIPDAADVVNTMNRQN